MIKPSRGAVKLEFFNLLNRFDYLFIYSHFIWLCTDEWNQYTGMCEKRRLKAHYLRLKNSSNKVLKKE